MTNKPSREDVLRIVGEPVGIVKTKYVEYNGEYIYADWVRPVQDGTKLYTEAQLFTLAAALIAKDEDGWKPNNNWRYRDHDQT